MQKIRSLINLPCCPTAQTLQLDVFSIPWSPMGGTSLGKIGRNHKKAFYKSIGRRKLTYAQLNRAIAQIEAIVNTRPLAKSFSSDLLKIPLHFVDSLYENLEYVVQFADVGDCEDGSYDPDLNQTARQAIQVLEHSDDVTNRFWEEWNSGYLTKLRDMQRIHLALPRHITQKPSRV